MLRGGASARLAAEPPSFVRRALARRGLTISALASLVDAAVAGGAAPCRALPPAASHEAEMKTCCNSELGASVAEAASRVAQSSARSAARTARSAATRAAGAVAAAAESA